MEYLIGKSQRYKHHLV